MIKTIIQVELLSDLCSASGDGFAGVVDTDVVYDEYGFPYIPAKRFRGCLREAALDILAIDSGYEKAYASLFGEAGARFPGCLKVENGRLIQYDALVSEVKSNPDIRVEEVLGLYTSIRSRTRIENGLAADKSLRATRVVNKGEKFEFPVLFGGDGENTYSQKELLTRCCDTLRHMGVNRSRGLGEVVCVLKPDCPAGAPQDVNLSQTRSFADKEIMPYLLALDEPVIAAERTGKQKDCESYLFGSALLGAFAALWLEKHGEDKTPAHECPEFRRLFLDGDVIFSAAFPLFRGEVYHPAPNTLKTDKLEKRFLDESAGVAIETNQKYPICKKWGGFVRVSERGVKKFTPVKEVFSHHSRPHNRAIARATGKGDDGGHFFSYEALAKGQEFAGGIIGSHKDLETLADLFKSSAARSGGLRLGRSRSTQYGKVSLQGMPETLKANRLALKNGDECRLVVVSPILLSDENGTETVDLNRLVDLLGQPFEIVRFSCSETSVAGYNAKWRLPRKQSRAIAEGSVVVLIYRGAHGETKEIDLINFVGERTNEGFGQIRFETLPPTDELAAQKLPDARPAPEDSTPCGLLDKVKQKRAEENVIALGASSIDDGDKEFPNNAQLSRIVNAVKRSDRFEDFAEKLSGVKQLNQQLSAFAFCTGEGRRYFIDGEPCYKESPHITRLLKGRAAKLFRGDPNIQRPDGEFSDDELFRLYRKWLVARAVKLRQNRKKKMTTQKEADRNV